MSSIRVTIVSVDNCVSSLMQSVKFYRDTKPDETTPDLMHVKSGDYHVSDVEPVVAFDIDDKKIGKNLSEAIVSSENCIVKITNVPTLGVEARRGPTLDSASKCYADIIDKSPAEPVDVAQTLKGAEVDVLVSYLSIGSRQTNKLYTRRIIDAGVAFVNALPVFIASDPEQAKRFKDTDVPVVDDDIKSQVGATITHRVTAKLFEDHGARLERTLQLNVGGNTDFKNMLEHDRLESKKISKTQAVTSNLTGPLVGKIDDRNVHIGPSDWADWLDDRGWTCVRLEGKAFGEAPLNLEHKLEVWDSPNSAGIIIDAVCAARIAKGCGTGGPVHAASSYLVKSPPKQLADDAARTQLKASIKGGG